MLRGPVVLRINNRMFNNINPRTLAWLIVLMLGMSLYSQWNMDKYQEEQEVAKALHPQSQLGEDLQGIPDAVSYVQEVLVADVASAANTQENLKSNNIIAHTDLFNIEISELGDIVSVELVKYPQTLGADVGVMLLSQSKENYFIAQRGLLNELGPDSKSAGRGMFTFARNDYQLGDDDKLVVEGVFTTATGVEVKKVFTFTRDNYSFEVDLIVNNHGGEKYTALPFGRLKMLARDAKSVGGMGIKVFSGGVMKTPVSSESYQKIDFDEFGDKKYDYHMDGGWLAFVQQYFIGAWVPAHAKAHDYSSEILKTKIDDQDLHALRFLDESIEVLPGETETVSTTFYAGPEVAEDLKALSPGLQKTLDYGIFWPLAWPIFLILKYIYGIVGNWGIAIIGTTMLIKLIFYKLSATSYRSMAKMKILQPQMESLKERHGEDKQALGQAMMQLYKDEKVNPLGGCLPMLIQIPVFIALYWVLIESVELRQAPLYLWIHDLSVKDPFYVLPLLMGASMFLQQRLSPAPPDPMQAKVMMLMPVIFTFLFLQFPAGLVLYWVANNLLSIAQQLYITKTIEKENGKPRKTKDKKALSKAK